MSDEDSSRDGSVGTTASGLRYDFEFSWESTYARAARLIATTAPVGRVLDVGAGVGELGAAVARFGFDYLGGDVDRANVEAINARGRVGFDLDLLDDPVTTVRATIERWPGEPIVAVAALDVIEHLPDPDVALASIGRIVDAVSDGTPPLLVVSIPNVAHYDLAAKLLLGRWDVTEVGLLDSTHVALFDERRLEQAFAGWQEIGRSDVVIERTEQRFPEDLPAFGATTLHEHLRSLRERASPSAATYQFVRAYRRRLTDTPVDRSAPAGPAPFLSVLTRTLGDRETLLDVLTSLAAQHDPDYELHVLVNNPDVTVIDRIRAMVAGFDPVFADRVTVHQVSAAGRTPPLNTGLDAARGEYVVVLDDDDLVTTDWVGAFKRLAATAPGRVLRAGIVVQWVEARPGGDGQLVPVSGFEAPYPAELDVLDTIRANRSPSCSYAVPMGLVRSLGLRFDESQRVAEDWKFQLSAVLIAGAASTPEITSVYRRASAGGSAAAESERVWIEDLGRVIDDLDREPTLLPAGSLRRIHQLYERIEHLERELADRPLRNPGDSWREAPESARRLVVGEPDEERGG